jgi:hypothetical protein
MESGTCVLSAGNISWYVDKLSDIITGWRTIYSWDIKHHQNLYVTHNQNVACHRRNIRETYPTYMVVLQGVIQCQRMLVDRDVNNSERFGFPGRISSRCDDQVLTNAPIHCGGQLDCVGPGVHRLFQPRPRHAHVHPMQIQTAKYTCGGRGVVKCKGKGKI